MTRRRDLTIVPLAVVAAAALLAGPPGLAHEGHEAEAVRGVIRIGDDLFVAPEVRAALGLETAGVDLGLAEELVEVPARLLALPERTGFASSRVSGRVKSLLVRPGDRVEAGEILGEIESLEHEASQGELLRAAVALAAAERERERVRKLEEIRAVSVRDAITAEARVRKARMAIEAARLRLSIAGLEAPDVERIERTGETIPSLPVVAPISGVVLRVDVERGQRALPTEHIVHIADMTRVLVEADVPESLATRVAPGSAARVRLAPGGAPIETVVSRLSPVVEHGSRKAWADVKPGGAPVLAGGSAVVAIVLSSEADAALAPRAAVFHRAGETFSFVEEPVGRDARKALRDRLADERDPLPEWAQNLARRIEADEDARKLTRRAVLAGRRTREGVEILDGLYPGESVVVRGGHELATMFSPGVLVLSDVARRGIGVESVEILPSSLDDVVSGFATVELPPGRKAALSPPLGGTIAAIRVHAGDRVEKGQVLAEIESVDAKSLSLDLVIAELELDAARSVRDRLRALAVEGIPSAREAVEAESDAKERETEAASLRRRLLALGLSSEAIAESVSKKRPIRAVPLVSPIDGRVSFVGGAIGAVVTGEDRLVEVVDPSAAWIAGALTEHAAGLVREGARARVSLASMPGLPIDAKVARLGRETNPAHRSIPIWAEILSKKPELLPGMTGRIAVVTDSPGPRDVLAVPREAILSDGGQAFVVVEGDDGRFLRVDTEIGRRDDRFVEVMRGVYPGDRVVVAGAEGVRTAMAGVR